MSAWRQVFAQMLFGVTLTVGGSEFARWLIEDFPGEVDARRRRNEERDTRAEVVASYAATHARLADDPEYLRLRAAAAEEERRTPALFFARNHLAIYVEVHNPMTSGLRLP